MVVLGWNPKMYVFIQYPRRFDSIRRKTFSTDLLGSSGWSKNQIIKHKRLITNKHDETHEN